MRRAFLRFGVLVTLGLLAVCVRPPVVAAPVAVTIAPLDAPSRQGVGSVPSPVPTVREPVPAVAVRTQPPSDTQPRSGGPKTTSTPTPRVVTLRPMVGGQADIDRCKLVLWSPNLIAGHNVCGGKRPWDFLDNIATGTTVRVVGTSAAGTYVVYGHKWQAGKGGPVPGWMGGVDLVLQTCTPTGTGFSLLRRS